MSVEIEGLDALIARLNTMQGESDGIVEEAIESAAQILKQEIESSVAISSISHKHIRDDITISRIEGVGTQKSVNIGPGKDTGWRAKFIEFGTKKMNAKPFMQPSLERKKRMMFEKIASIIRGRLGLSD